MPARIGQVAHRRRLSFGRIFLAIKRRLQNRPDSEHEVTLVRLALSLGFLIYMAIAAQFGVESARNGLHQYGHFFLIFIGLSLPFAVHMLLYPGISPARRLLAIPLDVLGFSFLLHGGDESTALFYPFYLWTIFGNGFRYGALYLLAASGFAIAGFGAVIATTPFWQQHVSLGIGLTVGLIVLPLYAMALIRKLSEAKRAAEEANRVKTMFLANVSHSLRTPLNAIIGLSDLLRDAPVDAERLGMIQAISRSGRSLLSQIDAILDVARMQVGNLPVKTEDIDLPALLLDINTMLQATALEKSVRLGLHFDGRTPRWARLNRSHLEEILLNLLGNALKFTQHGFVAVRVAPLERQGLVEALRFEVHDTGIGIAEDARGRIFENFAQADESIIDQFGGTGLGLPIARQLVEVQGGRIGVDSTPGAGSTFWFEIPCQTRADVAAMLEPARLALISARIDIAERLRGTFPDLLLSSSMEGILALTRAAGGDRNRRMAVLIDARAPGATDLAQHEEFVPICLVPAQEPLSAEALTRFCLSLPDSFQAESVAAALALGEVLRPRFVAPPIATATKRALNILIAEDNSTNQMVVRKILERAGHHPTIVINGQQVLDRFAAERFDVILMDVNMPVLNGVDTAKFIRFTEATGSHIPIFAFTADASDSVRQRCLQAGMDDCLAKPVDADKLLGRLAQLASTLPGEPEPLEIEAPPAEAVVMEGPSEDAPVDQKTLRDLEALGGPEFVQEIIDQFISDAAGVLKELSQAVATTDELAFRDQAHALRSCAANVGARVVFQLCLDWRAADAREIAVHGEEYVHRLEAEFDKARTKLAEYGKG